MKKEYNKIARIEYLLQRMKDEPMNIHQMADAINISIKSASKYLTELKFKKKVHIAKYERTLTGAYRVYYMTGDFLDVIKPVPLSQKEYNKKYKKNVKKQNKNKKSFCVKFVPRPDFASHWMFNPC